MRVFFLAALSVAGLAALVACANLLTRPAPRSAPAKVVANSGGAAVGAEHGVGMLKTDPSAATATSTAGPAADPALRILTYNLWGLPRPVGKDETRYADVARRLESFDVVAVQEAFTAAARRAMADSALEHQALGNYGELPFERLGDGLAVLSRHPIVRSDRLIYRSGCRHSDCLARKGALFVRLQVAPRQLVDVYTTHLQSLSEDPAADAIRRAQLDELSVFAARHDDGYPTLFLGDFNLVPDSAAHAHMLTRLEVADGWRAFAGAGLGPGHTISPNNSWKSPEQAPQRLDYVLLRDGRASRLAVERIQLAMDTPVAGRHLSDHFAVRASLRLLPAIAGVNTDAAGWTTAASARWSEAAGRGLPGLR